MNTLSIFLYLANVIPNIGALLVLAAIATAFIIVISTIARAHFNEFNHESSHKPYMPIFKWLALPIVLGLMAAVIPSERTMYMIAASELGEIAVMNEEVQEVFNALKERIMIELRPQENN